MQDLLDELKQLLATGEGWVVNGELARNTVVERALAMDPDLLRRLLAGPRIKRHFFTEMAGVLVFDHRKFLRFVNNRELLPDSFTAFGNKIGLMAGDRLLSDGQEVVLAWPFKDAWLEGGQTRDDGVKEEAFINEVLAPERIDRLLDPKALTGFKRCTAKGTRPVKSLSRSDHLLLKGNNLMALASLRKSHGGQVKLIYIDPPYNTGKDSFRYNDRFNHSAWLTFMRNRLALARELLRPDGVIFISIDDGEQAYLKVLCDELFGRNNYLGTIIWETATDNNPTQIAVEHEHVLAYARDRSRQGAWQAPSAKAQLIQAEYEKLKRKHGGDVETIEKELRAWIGSMKRSNAVDLSGVSHYSHVDGKGVFYPGNSANTRPGGYDFDILHPVTKRVCGRPRNGYRWPAATFRAAEARGDVLWPADEGGIPRIKKRLGTATEQLKSYFYEDNRKSTRQLEQLMGAKVFDNPKSVNLLKKIIRFTTGEGDTILDFFAGSGSTAEAVLQANREDGQNRRFILCEQLDYIETLTAERIRRVMDAGDSFVYAELATLNAVFLERIAKARSTMELLAIKQDAEAKGHIDHRFNGRAFSRAEFGALKPAEQKRMLVALLDKNQLYVPLSEIGDVEQGISPADRELNRAFYQ